MRIATTPALLLLLLLGWLLATPALSAAQVNTERLRGADTTTGFSGGLSAGLALKRGNVDFIELTGALWSRYQFGVHALLAHSRGAFGEQGDERFAGGAFAHTRWTAMWLERIGSELFGQIEYDEFVRLQRRLLFGVGPRFVIYDGEQVQVALGTAYMLEYERLDIPASDPHPQSTLYHRSSSYNTVRVQLSEVLALANTVYVQPRIVRFADTRVLDEIEIVFTIAEAVKWATTARVRFDSDPPSAVEKVDLDMKNSIELQW